MADWLGESWPAMPIAFGGFAVYMVIGLTFILGKPKTRRVLLMVLIALGWVALIIGVAA